MSQKQKKPLERALRFVKRKHRGQFRAGKTPAYYHLLRVYLLLDFILNQTKEARQKDKLNIYLAALGHDLLEDTNATEEEIRSIFGGRALSLILGLTNKWGDKNPRPYVRQVVNSEEVIRLIKLADLYDNISNVVYCFNLLGRRWVKSYFMPIVSPMKKAIVKTKFRRYKKSAGYLLFLVDTATALLEREISDF